MGIWDIDDDGGFVSSWKDVRNHIKNNDPFSRVPDGMEVIRVVGLTFIPGYPANILQLQSLVGSSSSDTFVNLVRNPGNKYDKNAIEVHHQGAMLGHLPKEVAARVAPLIDQGYRYVSTIWQVRVSMDNPNNPGLDILIEKKGVYDR